MLRDQSICLRDLWNSLGEKAFIGKVSELIEGEKPKLRPDDFNLRELWEAVDTTAFPTITGQLISRQIIDAYQTTPAIGENFVHTVPSNRKKEEVVGFVAIEQVKAVKEGMPYEESSLAEKKVAIENKKFGRILAITEEAVMEDQTGQILQRAASLGEKARLFKEKMILDVVRDVNSNAYNGSALYTSAHGNFHSVAFGTDGSGLEESKKLISEMSDENGDPILISGQALLVPQELEKEAYNLISPVLTESTYHKQILSQIYTSPFMTDATEFFYGDFKKQFRYQEVWPIQVLQAKEGHEDAFNRDIVAKYKVRLYGGCGAIDYRYVIKSEG
jgi:hypothetical protein